MARTVAERHDVIPVLAEVFREHGVEGASLAVITAQTGLGKGSLYHFFPGGKDEMVRAVLENISTWFEDNIFSRLENPDDPKAAILATLSATDAYFHTGGRVCLVGALAVNNVRDRFFSEIQSYFNRWMDLLARTLQRQSYSKQEARALAEEIVGGIQGALILARATDNTKIFSSAIKRYKARVIDL